MAADTNAYNPQGFSLGALGAPYLWMIANGFWLTCIACWVLAYYFWPLQFFIALMFGFRGREWSWGAGDRWASVEAFEESQSVWNIIGGILLGLQLSVLVVVSINMGTIVFGFDSAFELLSGAM